MALTLKQKFPIMLDYVEKEIPEMKRFAGYIGTIKALLPIIPEKTLQKYMNNMHLTQEMLDCTYDTTEDFQAALRDMRALWT